jgi:hypothetical protein
MVLTFLLRKVRRAWLWTVRGTLYCLSFELE